MLPLGFTQRMMRLLGDEYQSFIDSLSETAVKGIRINPIKCADPSAVLEALPVEPLSYVKDGYLLTEDVIGIGNTPLHHSGMIYVQDPGAMASAAALDVEPDMRIADLCAAPGGKATQLASMLGEGGFILANEYVPKRAKILVGNFERMGIPCGVVTSLDTKELAELYGEFFDIVVADAPCSGEGMFRKDVPAIEEWSEDNVKNCAERQAGILDNAAKMVRRGGKLLYSTCTYSVEENEAIVDSFLSSHPDFLLTKVNVELASVTSDGIVPERSSRAELKYTRRFYPHKAPGEGQFLALMEKVDGSEPSLNFRDAAVALSKAEIAAVENFFRENLSEMPKGRLAKYRDNIVLISHKYPIPPRSVFSAGVLIGELRGKVMIPSHQFFSVYGNRFLRRENISDEKVAAAYLSGEEIDAHFNDSGFCSVLYRGAVIGGGKMSGGKIKNHYPKGLRINK